tara:strand:+ start:6977 stop:7969 length:993 start_codon:yes stop_codon:yes gene_type:complete
MNILVTGACGFIGSHLVEKLVKLNYNVKAFTNYNSQNSYGWIENIDSKILKNIEVISGDIRDYEFLNKKTKRVDAIFHLAALIGIPYSYHAPRSYIDTNVTGTFNVLDCAKNNDVSKIFVTSTSEVYGTAQKVPIDETHSLNAQSPYAASKIGADQLALSFNKSFGLPVTILRPFNTFGPRQSARAIIPTIITQILKSDKIKLGNLTPKRDFTYVEDTVEAFVKALKANKISGEVINIGNNFEISIKDTLKIIKEIYGKEVQLIKDKKRIRPKNSEVNRLLASTKKAQILLKWKPQYAGKKGFRKGILKTINWFKKKQNLSLYKENIFNY